MSCQMIFHQTHYHMQRSYAIFFLLLFLLGCTPFNRVKSYRWLNNAKLKSDSFYQEIPFELRFDIPVFKVHLGENDAPFHFMFDSGGHTVLSEKAIQQTTGIKKKSYIDLGDAHLVVDRADIYALSKLKIGNTQFKNIGFGQFDFTESGLFNCLGIDGTLGPNILKKGIWHFDYTNKKIIFTDDLSKIQGIEQATQIPVMTNFALKPWLDFTLDGVTRKAILDLGATSVFIIPPKDISLMQENHPFVYKSNNRNVAGNSEMVTNSYIFKLDHIQIGDFALQSVLAATEQALEEYILGVRLLEYCDITFNIPQKEIYLHPRQGNSPKTEINTFGFSFDFEDGQLVVGALYANSPAQKAGIRAGDVVTKVNGQSYAFSDYCDFLNNFELGNLSELNLEIIRDGNVLNFKLKKAKVL